MSASPRTLVREAGGLVREQGGLVPFVRRYGFGGIAYALILTIVDGINSAGGLLLGPPRALGQGLILLIDTTIGGLLTVFDAGTRTSAQSFIDGTASLLGPLAQPTALGVGMITIGVFMWSINRIGFTPLSFVRRLRTS